MSDAERQKITIPRLAAMKARGERIAMITCYDATFARLLARTDVEMLLIGDSLGMVVQGHDTTIPVTLDDVLYHTKAVTRTRPLAHVVADMPFMSYQASAEQAMLSAGRLVKEGGAESVKLEGGMELVDTVARMTAAGIPVMAHIGLKPQRVHQMGGYKIQGKNPDTADQLLREAEAFVAAGAYGLLLEGVAIETAAQITQRVPVPTIGISSGPDCDGQVLVLHDLLGLNPDFAPKFVKRYADLGATVTTAVQTYCTEVKTSAFPTAAHGFHREANQSLLPIGEKVRMRGRKP
ncbi:MAG: 3-methyl-2-oxobutanoate hydroxymethyltransferase [Deltaproteobacteria bacterium]|nr:3-methyl-2-oxobutanoate hydroxymethyltransferase [Deltaproteobacteria bacterium]